MRYVQKNLVAKRFNSKCTYTNAILMVTSCRRRAATDDALELTFRHSTRMKNQNKCARATKRPVRKGACLTCGSRCPQYNIGSVNPLDGELLPSCEEVGPTTSTEEHRGRPFAGAVGTWVYPSLKRFGMFVHSLNMYVSARTPCLLNKPVNVSLKGLQNRT